MSRRFTNLIVAAMALGILAGYGFHANLDAEQAKTIAGLSLIHI